MTPIRLFISSVQGEFAVNDGFVTTIRRKTEHAAVGQPESQPESRPESQPESLRERVLGCLVSGALSKAEVSTALEQKEISGQLNKIVRKLLTEGYIEYTIPEKPNSRLQKYRLTKKGEQTAK